MNTDEEKYLWQDRKRTIFGLPISLTQYKLTPEKLIIITGFLSKKEEEIRLYRFFDFTTHRSLGERLFGIGTIHCCTGDKSTPEFDIKRVKNAGEIKDMISDIVEKERVKKRVVSRELMDIDDDDDDDCVR